MEKPTKHPKVINKENLRESQDIHNPTEQVRIPGDQFSEEQIPAEDIALAQDNVEKKQPKTLDSPDVAKTMHKAANFEKYLPEQYLNSPDGDIKNIVFRALKAGEPAFVEKLIKELQAHARRKSLCTILWDMLEEHKAKDGVPVEELPAGKPVPFKGLRDNTNKVYLETLSKEVLIRTGQQLGLIIDPGRTIPQMASSIAEYAKINKVSKRF